MIRSARNSAGVNSVSFSRESGGGAGKIVSFRFETRHIYRAEAVEQRCSIFGNKYSIFVEQLKTALVGIIVAIEQTCESITVHSILCL